MESITSLRHPIKSVTTSAESFSCCTKRNVVPSRKKSARETSEVSTKQGMKTSTNKTECQAKGFCKNLNSPAGKDMNVGNLSYDKSQNGSHDTSYDTGVGSGNQSELMDATDSGIEVIRALSSNGSNSDRFTPIQSCGSSLLSCSSEPEADRGSECESESSDNSPMKNGNMDCAGQRSNPCWKTRKTHVKTERSWMSCRKTNNYEGEGTSESCSETSSTHEAVTPEQLSRSIDFKRVNRLHESKKCENSKLSTVRRSDFNARTSCYEKSSVRSHSSARSSSLSARLGSGSKSVSASRNAKLSTNGKCEDKGSRTRGEEGKWLSCQRNQTGGARIRVSSSADPSRKNNTMSSSLTSSLSVKAGICETKSNALDKYGTLPRRPKKKSTDLVSLSIIHTSLSRSNSVSREPSLNRAATLRRQQSREKESCSTGKTLPPYPKASGGRSSGKTLIYHEISVQTVITGQDMSTSNIGLPLNKKDLKMESKGIQTEGRERHKKIEENYTKQAEELEKIRMENDALKTERKNMASRICKLLGYHESEKEELSECGLEELEKHFQAVGLTVLKQQEELSELRHYKFIANRTETQSEGGGEESEGDSKAENYTINATMKQFSPFKSGVQLMVETKETNKKDLEKSLAAQKNLLQQQQEIEDEYSELQEFLQAEKTALSESLLDTEEELNGLRREVAKKDSLLEQQQEECKHLVRICEQRRQENLSLEAKLAGLDQRSRDVLVQQGAAVSAAAVALSGLGARLDTLVDQLAVSCNISEKDLEDIVYHNEAYHHSEDNSPDESPSECQVAGRPKRGESFLQVLLSAIRNAAQSPFASAKRNVPSRTGSDNNPEALPFCEVQAEPCLNFEKVLEENSSSDTDHASFSRAEDTDELESKAEKRKNGESLSRGDSLQNLSDAILNRQRVEKNERRVSLDEIIPIEVNSLVDQIIDVDNLVTKLLKVIRIIQGESDRCMDELEGERDRLTGQLYEEKLSRQKLDVSLQRLKQELTEARSQLNTRISQLEEAKSLFGESQRVAIVEMEKRFAIIDTALGALNSVQDIVHQYPPLAKLRQDLEDCNCQRTVNGDVNANSAATVATINENGFIHDVKRNGAVLTTAI